MAPDEIRNPTESNPMLAFPYTKRHASQWNVNKAVAILMCSAKRALELNLDKRGWIYPLAVTQSNHFVPLAQRSQLHSRPGTALAGERALALAGLCVKDITAAELYSCFPSAIQSFALDLGLDEACPLTVTGSMAFSGGPFNNFSLEGVAKMVEVLRSGEAEAASARRVGLVSNLSGIVGKQACALFSNVPNEAGYGYEDVTTRAAAEDLPVPIEADYSGPASIVGYTVVFKKTEPSHAIAICDTPAGQRTVVRTEDRTLLRQMMEQEFCGRMIEVHQNGGFSSVE